jgi:hypothetical protein
LWEGCGRRSLAQPGSLCVPSRLLSGALFGGLAVPLGLLPLLFQGRLARLLGLKSRLLGL